MGGGVPVVSVNAAAQGELRCNRRPLAGGSRFLCPAWTVTRWCKSSTAELSRVKGLLDETGVEYLDLLPDLRQRGPLPILAE